MYSRISNPDEYGKIAQYQTLTVCERSELRSTNQLSEQYRHRRRCAQYNGESADRCQAKSRKRLPPKAV
eukprot:IDg10284t1